MKVDASSFYWLIVGTLVVWRVTHLLNAEDGPGNVFVHLRRLAGEGWFGELLDCFYCLSLWVAAPLAYLLGATWQQRSGLWLAMSAAAILLERATGGSAEVSSGVDVPLDKRSDNDDQTAA